MSRLRPRFSHELETGVEETLERIVGRIRNSGAACEVKMFPGFICLRIPEEERQYWSPRLHLNLEATPEGKTRVEGIYGPNANMWSSLLYLYLLIGSIGMFAAILGSCQCSLGMCPWGLWVFGGMLAVAVAIYTGARFGRHLGTGQMLRLHRIYEAAVGREVELRA